MLAETMPGHEQEDPLLSLRMKPSSSGQQEDVMARYDEALDSLAIMTSQDAAYKARDYLGRRRKRSASEFPNQQNLEEVVDETCRERMCEWSYRVCDHFGVSREIVAFTLSFLDRFIDRCSCDRTAFKLASMTSLYMATKMLNSKQISLASLAELSRGEFAMAHLAEMERIILETLDWKLNPPTAQSFIQHLRVLLPTMDEGVEEEIFERATFYAELSVYDYSFVTEDRYLIAVACILNAFQTIDDVYKVRELHTEFLASINSCLCVDVIPIDLERAQDRLWYLYSCSAQSQFDEVHHLHFSSERSLKEGSNGDHKCFTNSPVSVNMKGRFC